MSVADAIGAVLLCGVLLWIPLMLIFLFVASLGNKRKIAVPKVTYCEDRIPDYWLWSDLDDDF